MKRRGLQGSKVQKTVHSRNAHQFFLRPVSCFMKKEKQLNTMSVMLDTWMKKELLLPRIYLSDFTVTGGTFSP